VRYIQAISTTLAVCMMAALVACSSGSSSSTGGGGGGTTPISVALTGAPSSLGPNGTASITATVSNDSAAKGVTWSCTPASSCGSFNPTATASGTATAYTAPGAAGSVTVTATSVTDTTKTASATISIAVTQITLADGNYVYALSGSDTNASPYTLVGVFTLAGGKLTAGEQDFVDDTNGDLHDALNTTGSGYTTTADGNLQLTLTTCAGSTCTAVDTAIGPGGNGIETINGSMVSSTRARLIGYDTFATSSGTLDTQDATAAAATPTGPYIFSAGGYQGIAGGGILNFSGSTTVNPTGTVVDLNQGGTVELGETITASQVLAPDATGRVQVQVTLNDSGPTVINLVGYIVDASRIQIESGNVPISGAAYAQNTASLGVSGNNYVYGMLGSDPIGAFQSVGILTMGSSLAVTGAISSNDAANFQVPSASISGGTYVADTTNVGRYTLTGVTNGVTTFNIQLYVDGNGNALVLTADTTDVLEGLAYQQTASATMSGTYVMNDTGANDGTTEFELDAVGPVTTGTGTFSGFADLNWLNATPTQTADLTVAGAFTAPSSGVSTGTGNTITGLDVTTAANADAFDYYVVDSTRVIALDVDANLSQLDLAFFEATQ
jgi:hypothetical protein